jgi:hypothetical protein
VIFGLSLSDIATALGLLSTGGAVAWALLRARLGQDFATQKDLLTMDGRLEAAEARLASVPSHDDLRRLAERVGALEIGVAGTRAEVAQIKAILEVEFRAMREQMSRTDRQTTLLLRHQLEAEQRGGASA